MSVKTLRSHHAVMCRYRGSEIVMRSRIHPTSIMSAVSVAVMAYPPSHNSQLRAPKRYCHAGGRLRVEGERDAAPRPRGTRAAGHVLRTLHTAPLRAHARLPGLLLDTGKTEFWPAT